MVLSLTHKNISPRALILDNDIRLTHLIQIALTAEGFLTMGGLPHTIVNDIFTLKPNILLLDCEAESTTVGIALYQNLSHQLLGLNLPIILLSSSADLKKYAIDYKADAYVSKPFNLINLCNTVKDVLAI